MYGLGVKVEDADLNSHCHPPPPPPRGTEALSPTQNPALAHKRFYACHATMADDEDDEDAKALRWVQPRKLNAL